MHGRNDGSDRGPSYIDFGINIAVEGGVDERGPDERLADLQLALGVQNRHTRRTSRSGWGAVDFSGADRYGVLACQHSVPHPDRIGELGLI
jgi:hypothetical protein